MKVLEEEEERRKEGGGEEEEGPLLRFLGEATTSSWGTDSAMWAWAYW